MDLTEIVAEHIKRELAELRELRSEVARLHVENARLRAQSQTGGELQALGIRVQDIGIMGDDPVQDGGIFAGGAAGDADELARRMDANAAMPWEPEHQQMVTPAGPWPVIGAAAGSPSPREMWPELPEQSARKLESALGALERDEAAGDDRIVPELEAALATAERSAGLPLPEGTFRGPDDDQDVAWAARTAGFGGNGATP